MDYDSHMQASMQAGFSNNVGSMDYGDVPMSSMMGLQQQHHQTLANHHHIMTYNNPTSSTPTSLITTTNNNNNDSSTSHPHHNDMGGDPMYQPSLFHAFYGNHVGGSHYLLPLQEIPQDDLKHHLTNKLGSSSSNLPVQAVDSSYRISESDAMRAQIMSHPQYPQLVTAYLNCQKVGAPPEIVAGLDELSREYPNHLSIRPTVGFGTDPDLDQFMEDYCNLLQRYHEELTAPFKEAMSFFRKIELQLNSLSKGSVKFSHSGEGVEKEETNNASSEEDGSSGEIEFHDADPLAEEAKLKEKLLRKYSGYISALKHEFLKKKKKGKLPKEARQKLLDWWNQHYKWPYPSETEKTWLAESTGLDQKQINNWFINQRKRHWKPSEDLIHYSMVEDSNNTNSTASHHHYSPGNPFPDSATLKAQMGLLPMDQF